MFGTRSEGPDEQAQSESPADTAEKWVDFGSLKIPDVDGIGISVTLDDGQKIKTISLRSDGSELEMTLLAANPGHSLWEQVCAEIRAQLFAEGLSAQELEGAAGTELLTRRRGPYGVSLLRFVGIDGPGWMIHGVYSGPAAADTARGVGLANCLKNVIVRQCNPSLPERSPLPLTMPSKEEQSG